MSTSTETRQEAGFLRRFLSRPSTVFALFWVLVLLAFSLFPGQIAPYDPVKQDLMNSLSGPSWSHLLGTDGLGRDVLSRLIFGTKLPMLGALLAMGLSLLIGVPAGLAAGFYGGKIDAVISRFADMVQALPIIIVLMAVMAALGNSMWVGMAAFGLLAAVILVRIIRAIAESVRNELYVDAARVARVPGRVIVRRHVLPMAMSSVLVQGSLLIGSAVLIGAGLNFLGLGFSPPNPTWGSVIKEAGDVMNRQPWLMVPSGGIVIITVVVFNVLGDALRDASPVALRGSQLTAGKKAKRVCRRRGGQVAASVPSVAQSTEAGVGAAKVACTGDVPSGATLVVKDLSVSFGPADDPCTVVDRVGFSIGYSETVGLVGESGCGKTMTALAVLGLLPGGGRLEEGGQIFFEGQDIAGLPEQQMTNIRGKKIGFVSQEPMVALDPSFTIMSQLVEPLRTHSKMTRAEARSRALEALDRVGIPRGEAVAKSYPHQISGGMAQRVATAIALTGNPSLLIADEPTTALDVTVQAEILDLLRSLQESTGMSLLLVTHDLGVVADVCSKVIVMYAGQVVEQGPVSDVLTRPAHPYTAALLDSRPSSSETDEELPTIPGGVPEPGAWSPGCRFAPRCPLAEERCSAESVKLHIVRASQSARCMRCVEPLAREAVGGVYL